MRYVNLIQHLQAQHCVIDSRRCLAGNLWLFLESCDQGRLSHDGAFLKDVLGVICGGGAARGARAAKAF